MNWQPIDQTSMGLELRPGLTVAIDMSDLPRIQNIRWHAVPRRDGKGFYAVSTNGIRMHRFILSATSEIVDHKDGDGLNNRRSNIRQGTQSQNCVNRKTTPGRHLRGARPKRGRWQAYIKFRGKQRSLGYFGSEREAHERYLREAKSIHGDWMPLPEPPQ